MNNVRLRAVLLASLVIALLAIPTQAKDKWINLTTKNFNIISNADEGTTRKLALKLEQFHYVFFVNADVQDQIVFARGFTERFCYRSGHDYAVLHQPGKDLFCRL